MEYRCFDRHTLFDLLCAAYIELVFYVHLFPKIQYMQQSQQKATSIKSVTQPFIKPLLYLIHQILSASSGKRATIPAKIIIELPLPMPNIEICSPSHITNIEPTVNDRISINRKPQPGSITNCFVQQ